MLKKLAKKTKQNLIVVSKYRHQYRKKDTKLKFQAKTARKNCNNFRQKLRCKNDVSTLQ